MVNRAVRLQAHDLACEIDRLSLQAHLAAQSAEEGSEQEAVRMLQIRRLMIAAQTHDARAQLVVSTTVHGCADRSGRGDPERPCAQDVSIVMIDAPAFTHGRKAEAQV